MIIKLKDKVIGELKDALFLKFVDDKKHLMKIFGNTPGIQKSAWEEVKDKIIAIKITTKKGAVFTSTKTNFEKHSFEKDFGHGVQLFMERVHWTIR